MFLTCCCFFSFSQPRGDAMRLYDQAESGKKDNEWQACQKYSIEQSLGF